MMHVDGRTAGARQGDTRYQAHDEDCHAGTLSKYLKNCRAVLFPMHTVLLGILRRQIA